MDFTDHNIQQLRTSEAQHEVYDGSFLQRGSFGVRVSKGGRKVFFLIYPVNGKRRRVTLGPFPLFSVTEARNAAMQILRHGSPPGLPRTFRDLCALFLERHSADNCSVKTRREYQRMIDRELLPIWADRRFSEIARAEVILLLEQIRLERKTPVLAERLGALINTIFNFALDRALVTENPAAKLEKIPLPADRQPAAVMSAEDIQVLWNTAEHEPPSVQSCLRFLILTGQKVSDVLSMKWSDIELESWRIRGKNNRSRLFPLSPQAQQLLRNLRKVNTGEFAFTARGAEAPLSQIRAALNRVCKKAGISPAWTTREIRRSVEYALRTLRIRPDVIELFFGRTSARMPFRPGPDYDYEPDLRAAANLWGKKVHEYTRPTKKPPSGAKIIPLFPG